MQLGTPQEVNFGYVVPKGQRAQERSANRSELKYYGYVVEVYYDGVLQDRFARPQELGSR